MRRPSLLLAAAALAASVAPAAAAPLRLERVVLVMRHGVRPPTKAVPLPPGSAADPWPAWDVPPGYLTAHGAAAVRMLGAADRRRFAAGSLLTERGCPATGTVSVISDSDERTIATGDAWAAGLAPGCAIANVHRPQDVPDPLFGAAGDNGEPFDPARADRAVTDGLGSGGLAAAEHALRPALDRLDRILCGPQAATCGVGSQGSALVPAAHDRRPKLSGALDRGSTGAQVLLLEYADGKPAADVGWGRATAADITALSALHAAEFAILARPPYLATRNAAPLVRRIDAALAAEDGTRIVALIGHDTNVASIGGVFGLHWQVPGYAADDPPPGGALVFLLWRDRDGRRYVETQFRAQTLEALRAGSATPAGMRDTLTGTRAIAGCARLCPLDRFRALVKERLQ